MAPKAVWEWWQAVVGKWGWEQLGNGHPHIIGATLGKQKIERYPDGSLATVPWERIYDLCPDSLSPISGDQPG